MKIAECELIIREYASHFGVNPEIDEHDGMFGFGINMSPDGLRLAVHDYFAVGADSAQKLTALASDFLDKPIAKASLLEFASGSGRVTRHLLKNWPGLTASDIQNSAVTFMRGKLGIEAIESCAIPEDFSVDREFDVVFALSLFSHLPEKTFSRWCKKLSSVVSPGGIFVFTTHGRLSVPVLKSLGYPAELSDFWFFDLGAGNSLPGDEYGQTIVTRSFVNGVLSQIPDMESVDFREGYWGEHQDLYVWRRRKSAANASFSPQQPAA